MALSEIEKLERRYAENPQGLTFAPLAEVHRKNGDVKRALELLKPGLDHHPNYTPASIVLGRCHLDLGDLPAAEAAFAHVLGLDAENVIALKALADISERLHRFDDAEHRLRELLAVDRSNDEAREQLARLELARSQTASASADPAVPQSVAVSVAPELAEASTSESGSPTSESVESQAPSFLELQPPVETEQPAPLMLEELEPSHMSQADLEPPPEGLELDEPVSFVDQVEPLSGLVGRDQSESDLLDEFRVETSEDIVLQSAGGGEFQVPNAAEELFAREIEPSPFGGETPSASSPPELSEEPASAGSAPVAEPASESELASVTEEPATIEELPRPEKSTLIAEAPPETPQPVEAIAESPPVTSLPGEITPVEPEPVITETMAEVLLDQGHQSEALRVYRELENRGTGEPKFAEKIAELEAQVPAPARRAYSAAETRGRPIREMLREILAARPPAVAPAPVARPTAAPPPSQAAGAPTRPAAEALSLSSVFGEETSPSPPAVPAPGGQEAGVSFDEFYGTPAAGGTAKASRAPDPKNDDLDQFHAWLQNLKR